MAWVDPKRKGDGPPYYVRWREGGKLQRSDAYWDFKEVTDACHAKDNEKPGRSPSTLLAALLNFHIQEQVTDINLAPSTQYLKKRLMQSFLDKYPTLGELTVENIDAWKTYQTADGYSPTTISIALRIMRTFCKWCHSKGYISVDPMVGFKIPVGRERTDRAKDKKDIEILIKSARDPIFKLFLTFCFFQGLRKKMIRLAKGSELDITRKMWVIPKGNTKARREEYVPIHPRVIKELKVVYGSKIPLGPIFQYPDGRVLDDSLIYEKWKTTKKYAKIPYPLTIHGARRTWATEFMKHTQSLPALMAAGAWKDVDTAMKYQHLSKDWLQKEVKGFDYE